MTVQQRDVRISHRETRLRRRIDELTDQRDRALEELWEARDQNDELDRRIDRLHESNSRLRRDRDKWRERAQGAEWGAKHNPEA